MSTPIPITPGMIEEVHAIQLRGDRFAEAELFGRLIPRGRTRGNDHDGRTPEWRFFSKVAYGLASDCWYWVGSRHKLGYGIFNDKKAHRVSWEMYHGPIPGKLFVCHRCDVRCCVNPSHLFLGTQSDNMRDMVAKGRRGPRDFAGERNGYSKLTDEQVRLMREIRRKTGATYRQIAGQFGVTTMTALRAITGTSWKHISGDQS
jgi:hypothetical protein